MADADIPDAVASTAAAAHSTRLDHSDRCRLVGAYIAITSILARGPTVTISFRTAEGLEAGKTKIRYKDVEIGLITHVALGT